MFAVAEFGSRYRKTADSLSDKDLLVVCPERFRRKLYARYSDLGYSVTLLSKKQLERMQACGSLFIQHLKLESAIQIDAGSQLRTFLETCDLKEPNSEEIDKCKSTLKFISAWPKDPILSAWKSDFLFCASRDYLIKVLARKRQLAFGLEDIERRATRLFGMTAKEFADLYSLREGKAAYRGTAHISDELPVITIRWLNTLHRRFGIPLPRGWPLCVPIEYNALVTRVYSSTYERLRSLEAVYLVACHSGAFHPEHDRLMKHIVQPNLYRSCQHSRVKTLQKFLFEVTNLVSEGVIQHRHTPLRFSTLNL